MTQQFICNQQLISKKFLLKQTEFEFLTFSYIGGGILRGYLVYLLTASAYVPSIYILECEGSFSFAAIAQSPWQKEPHLTSC